MQMKLKTRKMNQKKTKKALKIIKDHVLIKEINQRTKKEKSL